MVSVIVVVEVQVGTTATDGLNVLHVSDGVQKMRLPNSMDKGRGDHILIVGVSHPDLQMAETGVFSQDSTGQRLVPLVRGHAPMDEKCCRRGLQPRLGIAVVTVVAMIAIAKAIGVSVVGKNVSTGMGIKIRKGVAGGAVIGEDSSSGSRGGWISIVAIGGTGVGGLIITGSSGGGCGGSGSRRVSRSAGMITAVAVGSAGVGGLAIVVLVVLTGMVVEELGLGLGLRLGMVGKLLMSLMRGHGSGEISKGRLSVFHGRETAHHGDNDMILIE